MNSRSYLAAGMIVRIRDRLRPLLLLLKLRSYAGRHWRGELPLWHSFWVNLVLLSTLPIVPAFGFVFWFEHFENVTVAAAGMLVILMGMICLMPWQLIGTWRAAGQYRRDGGNRVIVTLTYLMLIACWINVATAIPMGRPLVTEIWHIVNGVERSQFFVSMSDDGSAIEFTGNIGFGAARRVRQVIEAAPGAQWLVLQSPGGRVVEAHKLRALVERHRLNTAVSDHCSSACFLVFISGKERHAAPNTRIGVHGITDAAGANPSEFTDDYERERAYLRSRGLHEEFVRKIYEAPSTRVWWLSRDELERYGIITNRTN
jgi:hypothetical protein